MNYLPAVSLFLVSNLIAAMEKSINEANAFIRTMER
jgi:hypothetical protein